MACSSLVHAAFATLLLFLTLSSCKVSFSPDKILGF